MGVFEILRSIFDLSKRLILSIFVLIKKIDLFSMYEVFCTLSIIE